MYLQFVYDTVISEKYVGTSVDLGYVRNSWLQIHKLNTQ